MRTVSGHKSVNTLLEDLIRAHKMARMRGELDNLQEHLQRVADVNVDKLSESIEYGSIRGLR